MSGEAGAVSANSNIAAVQRQFRRQAEAYEAVPIVTDPDFLGYIVSISGVLKHDRVLDVASGPGFVGMAFAPHCSQVVGIDATDRFVARANAEAARRQLYNIEFVLGNVEVMAFPDARFDVAVCRFAFHHFARPQTVLAEMRRVIKPGGTLVIVDMVASEDPAKAGYHNEIERLCDPSHARALSASEFERIFRDHGLDVTYKQTVKSSYGLEEWIAHGAPPAESVARIHQMMESSIETDRSGLSVRRTKDGLSFSHTGASYVMRRRS
jgi:ubiquinone/menaquinone biosynthesis C-methylase UbiE